MTAALPFEDWARLHSPRYAYCADDLKTDNCYSQRKPLDAALQHWNVQLNRTNQLACITVDVDRQGGAWAWLDARRDLPRPSVAMVNQQNGNAHLTWFMATPVLTAAAARPKPRYLAAKVQHGLTVACGGDMRYSGLLTKSPVCGKWGSVYSLSSVPLYELGFLADCVDIDDSVKPKERVDSGIGRNCTVLDNLSHWAYREIRHYRSATYENWLKACIKKACELNCFCPEQGGNLSYSEILGIAKSVANFCRKHDPYHAARHAAKYSSEKQAKRGRLGGIQSGIVRQPCEDKVTSARLMHANGMSTRQIGDELGVGKSTVARWISQL